VQDWVYTILRLVFICIIAWLYVNEKNERRQKDEAARKDLTKVVNQRSDIQWAFTEYVREGSKNPSRFCKHRGSCIHCECGYCVPPTKNDDSGNECHFSPIGAPDITIDDYDYW